MDQEKSLSGSHPAMVIAVGEFSSRVVCGVEEILRLDISSAMMQDFLYVGMKDGIAALLDKPSIEEDDFTALTEDVFLANLPAIRSRLDDVFHRLQAHENLMRGGYQRGVDQPLSIYLLADFSAEVSNVFFPLWLLLDRLLSRIPDAKGYALLQIASFAQDEDRQAEFMAIHEHVRRFDDWLGCGDCTDRKELAHRLGLRDNTLWAWHPFFFDRYKEGVWEAKDRNEIQMVMENFLLALLVSDLGDDLCRKSDQLIRMEQKAYYNSASASAMLYDPNALIENCIYRFGTELLASEFDAALPASSEKVMQQAESILRQLGTLRHWMSEIIDEIPIHTGVDALLSFQYNGERTEFDGLPETEWAYAISADHQHILEALIPGFLEKIAARGLRSSLELPEILTGQYRTLIENPDFYPGAVANLKALAGELRQTFLQRSTEVDQACMLLSDELLLSGKFEDELKKIDDLVALLRTPPVWFRWFPDRIRQFAEQVFRFLFSRNEYLALVESRQKSLAISNAIIANCLARETAGQLVSIAGCLCDPADEIAPNVDRLSSVIASVQLHFEQKAQGFQGTGVNFFRIPLLSEKLISDIYLSNQPAFNLVRTALLQAGFLSEWEMLSDQLLAERLYEFSREKFLALPDVDLDSLLLRHDLYAPEEIAEIFSHGMLPLLRVSFDHIGVGHSTLMNYLVSRNASKSSVYRHLSESDLHWHPLESSHIPSMIAVQVRQAIPLSAMVSLADMRRQLDALRKDNDEKEDK